MGNIRPLVFCSTSQELNQAHATESMSVNTQGHGDLTPAKCMLLPQSPKYSVLKEQRQDIATKLFCVLP